MKYPVTLLGLATVMLLVGLGIRMHADWRYRDKMFYHTIESGLYRFDDVFAERKMGDTIQLGSVITGVAGGVWFVVLAIRRDQRKSS
jgi:hypothetical protein